jgi:glycosyltransferase involved in cell wall biosynthesis
MSGPHLFVDIQAIQSLRDADRGISRFATELSRALIHARAPVAALGLNPVWPWPRRIHPDLARAPQLTWNTATTFRRALADGPVVYVVVSPFELSRPVHAMLGAHIVGVPRVAIVHDLIPHLFPRLFGLHDQANEFTRVYTRRVETIRSFDLVLTPSENSRRDVIEHWGIPAHRIEVVGEAASPFFARPGPHDRPADLLHRDLASITRPFVLCVSGREPHKNNESLIEAWARLSRRVRDAYQLVIACRLTDDDRGALTRLARRVGIERRGIVITGYVDDEVLRALYQVASLFVLPSRYEGFGLPVLEAVNCGCPAITSNTSSLPEVLDWPAATFSPEDPDEISRLIERGLADAEYRAELDRQCRRALQRHRWPGVVERVLAACARFSEPRPRRPRRLRIALVGQFPPSRSWSAGANGQLAEYLARACDLDCFTEPFDARTAYPDRSRTYRMFPAAALGPTFTPAAYDLVLYTVGATPDAAHRLARTYPGVVWFHDLALAGRELVERARGVIVGSELACSLLEQEVGMELGDTPVWVLPSAVSGTFGNASPPGASERPWSYEEVARHIIEIAALDLEQARPQEAPINEPVP